MQLYALETQKYFNEKKTASKSSAKECHQVCGNDHRL